MNDAAAGLMETGTKTTIEVGTVIRIAAMDHVAITTPLTEAARAVAGRHFPDARHSAADRPVVLHG